MAMHEELAAADRGDAVVQGLARRRTVLLSATAAGATAVLAACGTDDSAEGNAPAGSTDTATDAGTTPAGQQADGGVHTGVKIAAAADIPVGGGAIFASHGVVVTQPTAGTFKGFDVLCTHKQCPVSKIEGGAITCTCHGSKFSVEDGSVTKGPATQPLAAKAVTNEGGTIVLG